MASEEINWIVGERELNEAFETHDRDTLDVSRTMILLGLDEKAALTLLERLTRERKSLYKGEPRKYAYMAGFIDGLLLGVKAVLAISYSRCSECGKLFLKPDDADEQRANIEAKVRAEVAEEEGKAPEDVDMHIHLLCHDCFHAAARRLSAPLN